MWDLRVALPFGRISIRNIFMFAAAMFVATFAYIFFTAPVARAADGDWIGESISYNQHQYIKQDDAKKGDGTGFPAGTQIYTFTEPKPADPNLPQKIHVIYFAPGADPPKEKTATYAVYDFTPPTTYKNPTDKATITLTPRTADDLKTTSCDSTFTFGIGWIVCPVTNFLASAMDWLFDIISSFMVVRPVQTTQENMLFRAWSYMRNFANVMFVIAFLVIIYSQLSNVGLSTYHIKRMLPRLVIAAILVNISYWICAIAIDISNVLGYSIQDIFIALRNNLVGAEGNGWSVTSWKSVAGFILSGGLGATAVGIGAYAVVGGAVGGAIYMLIPILLGVLLAALVALLVLAARQAIITILVIVSPLAFVAYILPNTEKYFTKWRELGMTMLIMFPAFSVIFGGSQLAGIAIIQNADSINLLILGMAVQVAPVAITPLLLRFSGSLLTRIAGFANNPNRGLLDRTRKWSQERADQHKAQVLASTPRRRDFMARATQSIDRKDRTRKGWQQANNSFADARWANDHNAHSIHQASEEAKMLQDTGDAISQAAVERLRTTNGHRVQVRDVNLRVAKLDVDVAKAQADVQWENLRSQATSHNAIPGHLAHQASSARQSTIEAAVAASQMRSAHHEQQQEFAKALVDDIPLQERAGGISEHGADSALAAAIAAKRKAYGESVNEAAEIIKHFNLSGTQRQELAMGKEVEIKNSAGQVIKTFNEHSTYAREAAIEAQLSGKGNFDQMEKIIIASGSSLSDFKTTISEAIAKNKLTEKAAYLGGQTINQVSQGEITDVTVLNTAVARTIAQGKIKPAQLATMDADAVKRVLEVVRVGDTSKLSTTDAGNFAQQVNNLKIAAARALDNENLSGNIADNARPHLEAIRHL